MTSNAAINYKALMPKENDTHTLTCLIGATQLPDTSLTTEEREVKRHFQFISLDNISKCRISLVYSLIPRLSLLGTRDWVGAWVRGPGYEGLGMGAWV